MTFYKRKVKHIGSKRFGIQYLGWSDLAEQGSVFIYGGAVALETEIYLSDAIALTASVKERLVWGNSTGHFHTQFGIGMKFIIN
ncbi:conjugal transfer protein TraO [Segatella copri]|uniref:conjugal transfer protein TraO n=1 Tax=Segatella copri TaxID=165179 RepID=UPI003B524E1E